MSLPTGRAVPECPVLDADSHLVESAELWDVYLPARRRQAAGEAFRPLPDGGAVLNGQRVPGLCPPGLPRHALWRPGMRPEDVGALDPGAPHPANPGASDPAPRLRDLDAMGVDAALLLPTWFAEYHPLVKDPELAALLAEAYNRFALDFAAADPARLLPAAVLPVQDVERAVAALRGAAAAGFRAAFWRPVFANGRYPSDRAYAPLWRAFEELQVVAVLHPTAGPAAPELDANAAFVERVAATRGPGHPVAPCVAPAMDAAALLVAMLADGLLERHPRLRLLFAHAGVAWVPLALEKAETYLWLSHQREPVSLEPEAVFAARACAATFCAGDGSVRRMPELFAAFAAWGSRYPGHDAADAFAARADLETGGVAAPERARLLGGNAAGLLGVSLEATP